MTSTFSEDRFIKERSSFLNKLGFRSLSNDLNFIKLESIIYGSSENSFTTYNVDLEKLFDFGEYTYREYGVYLAFIGEVELIDDLRQISEIKVYIKKGNQEDEKNLNRSNEIISNSPQTKIIIPTQYLMDKIYYSRVKINQEYEYSINSFYYPPF